MRAPRGSMEIFILSESGKPVYARYGDASGQSDVFALISSIMFTGVEIGGSLRFVDVEDPDTVGGVMRTAFLFRAGLVFAAVARSGPMLTTDDLQIKSDTQADATASSGVLLQLAVPRPELMASYLRICYEEIVLTLSGAHIRRTLDRSPGFDLRRMLVGNDLILKRMLQDGHDSSDLLAQDGMESSNEGRDAGEETTEGLPTSQPLVSMQKHLLLNGDDATMVHRLCHAMATPTVIPMAEFWRTRIVQAMTAAAKGKAAGGPGDASGPPPPPGIYAQVRAARYRSARQATTASTGNSDTDTEEASIPMLPRTQPPDAAPNRLMLSCLFVATQPLACVRGRGFESSSGGGPSGGSGTGSSGNRGSGTNATSVKGTEPSGDRTVTMEDLMLVLSWIHANRSFRTGIGGGEMWVPICLPRFDDSAFVHCYVAFIDAELKIGLVCLSPHRDDFFEVARYRAALEGRLFAGLPQQMVNTHNLLERSHGTYLRALRRNASSGALNTVAVSEGVEQTQQTELTAGTAGVVDASTTSADTRSQGTNSNASAAGSTGSTVDVTWTLMDIILSELQETNMVRHHRNMLRIPLVRHYVIRHRTLRQIIVAPTAPPRTLERSETLPEVLRWYLDDATWLEDGKDESGPVRWQSPEDSRPYGMKASNQISQDKPVVSGATGTTVADDSAGCKKETMKNCGISQSTPEDERELCGGHSLSPTLLDLNEDQIARLHLRVRHLNWQIATERYLQTRTRLTGTAVEAGGDSAFGDALQTEVRQRMERSYVRAEQQAHAHHNHSSSFRHSRSGSGTSSTSATNPASSALAKPPAVPALKGQGSRTLKFYELRTKDGVTVGVSSAQYEIYAMFSPVASNTTINSSINSLAKALGENERNLFMSRAVL
eukprot:Clim_evm35s134 gene=Clim_evmTU35s134